jgi:hypothetical protein
MNFYLNGGFEGGKTCFLKERRSSEVVEGVCVCVSIDFAVLGTAH